MERIVQFDTVRVVRLIDPPESHLAVSISERAPRIGDTGVVVDLLGSDGRIGGSPDAPDTRYLVENVASDGRTVWLAEFMRHELRLVQGAG